MNSMSEKYSRLEPNTNHPLEALKQLNYKSVEPVKRLEPKVAAKEAEYAPITKVERLIGLAKDNNDKITLHQARFELADDTLRIEDLEDLFSRYAPNVQAKRHPRSTLYLEFMGNAPTKPIRNMVPRLDEHIML
jgi:hypothetical protein